MHKWTSLICTLFLLLLCITGLPLIFHHELEELLENHPEPAALPVNTPMADLDRVVEAGLKRHPGEFVQFVIWDPDEPQTVSLSMAHSPTAASDNNRAVVIDGRTAQILHEPALQEGLLFILLKLHIDMFAGLSGKLFLGLMGLLFIIAIVSGAVVYGPFMRRLNFGTVRKDKSFLQWLDLHNLLGIVTLVWALVVGATGMINTWADLVIKLWQYDQLSAMTAPYKTKPMPAKLASLERAVATARQMVPDMTPAFVAFPGSLFSSNHHYAVFLRGKTPLTARLLKPVLIDAENGALTDKRDLPWYVTALLVSQPLHFGDYGGMPMKIIWALLDIVTIVVLISGLYLWFKKRNAPIAAQLNEMVEPENEETASTSIGERG